MIWYYEKNYKWAGHVHKHDGHQMTICLGGAGVEWIDGKKYPFRKNHTIFILAGVKHFSTGTENAPAKIASICFSDQNLIEYSGINTLKLIADIVKAEAWIGECAGETRRSNLLLFEKVKSEVEDESPLTLTILGGIINGLVANHFRSVNVSPGSDRRYSRAVMSCCRRIAANPSAPVTLSGMARQAGMSRTVFAEAFRQCTGGGLIEFTNHTRVNAAAEMLASGESDIQGVARACGFGSISNFYEQFRRWTGTSPKKYRISRAFSRKNNPDVFYQP